MKPSELIRAKAANLGYFTLATPAQKKQIRADLADRYGWTRQQITSALRHGPKPGRPRKHPRCPTCGQAWPDGD